MKAACVIVALTASCGRSDTPATDAAAQADSAGAQADAAAPPGDLLFAEPFETTDFAGRGWYDSSGGALSSVEHIPGGSTSSFECRFQVGDVVCVGGTPARHPVTPTENVYLRFWIKLSDDWVGSGQPYHPHMFHFVTDADPDYVGPAATHLTTYTEIVQGRPLLAIQDSLNVDPACILRNDDSFVGCGGDFASYVFTEARSVAACNGLVGDVDGRDCFSTGPGWYSSRSWDASQALTLGQWHLVEALFRMNSIQGGVGVPDGQIRFWSDGELVISSDMILLRTAANATIRFDQFLMLPYIGDGSPAAQTFWIDDLEVRTAP